MSEVAKEEKDKGEMRWEGAQIRRRRCRTSGIKKKGGTERRRGRREGGEGDRKGRKNEE